MIILPETILYRHRKFVIAPAVPTSKINFFDLTLVLNGSLKYVIDDEKITVNTGDVIFIKQNSRRRRFESESPVDYVSFNFVTHKIEGTDDKKYDSLPSFDLEKELFSLPLFLEGVISNEIKLLIAALDTAKKDIFTLSERGTSFILFSILYFIKCKPKTPMIDPAVVLIEKYLKENYQKKITLADIEKLTYFSATHCEVIFKKATDRTIVDYLLDIRISEAKKLLIRGNLTLSEIAERTGFSDNNYFSRVFKKRTGYSPNEYKKMIS